MITNLFEAIAHLAATGEIKHDGMIVTHQRTYDLEDWVVTITSDKKHYMGFGATLGEACEACALDAKLSIS